MSSALSARVLQHRKDLATAMIALYDPIAAGERVPTDPKAAASHSSKASPAATEDYFAENITFRDPLMKVAGIQHYRAQFAALHSLCPKLTMQVFSVTWGEGPGNLTAGSDNVPAAHVLPGAAGASGSGGINASELEIMFIDALCTYEVNKWIRFPIRQLTSARISKDASGMSKIVAHEDMWSMADLLAYVPFVGSAYRYIQQAAGSFVSNQILRRFSNQAGVRGIMGDDHLNTSTLHAVYHPIESERVGKKPLHPLSSGHVEGTSGGKKSGSKGKESGESKDL